LTLSAFIHAARAEQVSDAARAEFVELVERPQNRQAHCFFCRANAFQNSI
jgi:hypothetical protein